MDWNLSCATFKLFDLALVTFHYVLQFSHLQNRDNGTDFVRLLWGLKDLLWRFNELMQRNHWEQCLDDITLYNISNCYGNFKKQCNQGKKSSGFCHYEKIQFRLIKFIKCRVKFIKHIRLFHISNLRSSCCTCSTVLNFSVVCVVFTFVSFKKQRLTTIPV